MGKGRWKNLSHVLKVKCPLCSEIVEIQQKEKDKKGKEGRFPIVLYKIHGAKKHTLVVYLDHNFNVIDILVSTKPIEPIYVKIIFIGDANVGKTTIIHRFVLHDFIEEYRPTIGANIATNLLLVEGALVNTVIWDIAGQTLFQMFRGKYYKDVDCAILVYDVTNKESFRSIKHWWRELNIYAKNTPVILVGNKIDLGVKRVISTDDGIMLARKLKIPFFETSAKHDLNIQTLFIEAAKISLQKPKNNDYY